jgi:hypothetical protein
LNSGDKSELKKKIHPNGAMHDEACCFVCLESEGSLLSVCGCTTRLVHSECMAPLITRVRTHTNQCPVCKRAYRLHHRRRGTTLTIDMWMIALTIVSWSIATIIIFLLIHLVRLTFSVYAKVVVTATIVVVVFNTTVFWILICWRRPAVSCAWINATSIVCNHGRSVPLDTVGTPRCSCKNMYWSVQIARQV